jgi:hypothetical protein
MNDGQIDGSERREVHPRATRAIGIWREPHWAHWLSGARRLVPLPSDVSPSAHLP